MIEECVIPQLIETRYRLKVVSIVVRTIKKSLSHKENLKLITYSTIYTPKIIVL